MMLVRLLFLGIALSFTGCSGLSSVAKGEKPKANLDKVELTKLSFLDMDLDFQLSLQNPYPIGLRVASVQATFLVENNQVFATETTDELIVEPNGNSMMPFQLNLKFADLARVVGDYAQKESLETEIQLVVTVKLHNGTLPGVPETWPFEFTLNKSLPTIKPSVDISNFKIEGPNAAQIAAQLKAKAKEMASNALDNVSADSVASALTGLLSGGKPKEALQQVLPEVDIRDLDLKFALEFTLSLDNQTPTALLFSNLAFKFQMNGEPLIDGTTREVTREGNRSLARIRGEFSARSLSDGLLEAFKTRRSKFGIQGDTKVKLPDIIRVEPVTLNFTEQGDFSLN